ncbi:TIGR04282 family arsenosugar biosynthesis glycosyltransferase [Erythrobacter sp. EC-HK427]|uniref:TIGR04282 family arsenosugar biosynthesis glycosyltransferase n=1 Tax=Erythrobacter sp. EC-HK427 TaxID=2038396 RepID=UPI0012548CF4|nr:TIGR04282 family arsenosugar biosynthesis glycosyltransferase [Erythrobacter sp. EC-HK427]VVS99204.1 conserved hypothetical protein [Erythrobacter sp. EC-HK427]
MANPLPTIALFARYPVAGKAKTRLIPALGAEGAAELHRLLVERTLSTMRASGLPFAVWTTGEEHAAFAQWPGEDVPMIAQGEGDLGARLARVPAPAILLGADIPDVTAEHLLAAAKALEEVPVVIGPASDGGYYLLGFRDPVPFLFDDMPWGTEQVRALTEARLEARGISYRLLQTLDDCDRPEDLAKWPELLR